MKLGKSEKKATPRTRVRSNLLATATLFLTSLFCSPNDCGADEAVQFDIPAQDFPAAILEYSHQSHWRTLFNHTDPFTHLRTKPIHGKYAPAEALALMLKGTPVVVEFRDDGYFSIWGPPEWYPYPLPGMATGDSALSRIRSSWTTATAAHQD